MSKCPNCSIDTRPKITGWTFFCNKCGLWTSNLGSKENKLLREIDVSEKDRVAGLKNLRMKNAKVMSQVFEKHETLKGKTLCDIGSGYGWFNEVFKSSGAKVLGIEPEKLVAKKATEKTRMGYFPDVLKKNEKFDVMSFNDVFEHMGNPNQVLKEIKKHLNTHGKLIISVPSSNGLLYRISPLFYRLGYKEPWNRLWQREFNSPHVLYFNAKNLKSLIEKNGFKKIDGGRLKTFEFRGLKNRIDTGEGTGKILSYLLLVILWFMYPLINYILPSDSVFGIFEKT